MPAWPRAVPDPHRFRPAELFEKPAGQILSSTLQSSETVPSEIATAHGGTVLVDDAPEGGAKCGCASPWNPETSGNVQDANHSADVVTGLMAGELQHARFGEVERDALGLSPITRRGPAAMAGRVDRCRASPGVEECL